MKIAIRVGRREAVAWSVGRGAPTPKSKIRFAALRSAASLEADCVLIPFVSGGIYAGPWRGKFATFGAEGACIGSSPNCELSLQADLTVSSVHARITVRSSFMQRMKRMKRMKRKKRKKRMKCKKRKKGHVVGVVLDREEHPVGQFKYAPSHIRRLKSQF